LREEASNRPPGPWLKTVVLSGVGKGALDVSGRDQEGERKRIADEVSKNIRVTSKLGCINYPGMSLAGARLLARWCPAWRRREPDQAAFAWNVRCAGINRQEERDENARHRRSSDPRWPRVMRWYL
jgi:hypothetical protein